MQTNCAFLDILNVFFLFIYKSVRFWLLILIFYCHVFMIISGHRSLSPLLNSIFYRICPDSCTSQYMKIDKLIDSYRMGRKWQSKPPSEVILKELVKGKYAMTDARPNELSEKVLLPDDVV